VERKRGPKKRKSLARKNEQAHRKDIYKKKRGKKRDINRLI